jgi:hypothetical protein
MSGFGSMASFLAPGLGVAGAVGKLAGAGKIVQGLVGGGAMAALEAGIEQSERISELTAAGMDPAQAHAESERIFWLNLPVIMATNLPLFSTAGRVAKALIEAPSEALQERLYYARSQDRLLLAFAPIQAIQKAPEQAALASRTDFQALLATRDL